MRAAHRKKTMRNQTSTILRCASALGVAAAITLGLAACGNSSAVAAAAAASMSVQAAPSAVVHTSTTTFAGMLPDPKRTPGALNHAVTQATIHRTICVTGYTATIRPPSNLTTSLKIRQLATGYAYRGDTATAHYEEDHLISLELGGSPTAEANLWPEPYTSGEGAHIKDRIENKLHALVCAGDMKLSAAQHAIATNWVAAYTTYVGAVSTVAPPAAAPAPAPATKPAPATGVIHPGSLCPVHGAVGHSVTGKTYVCGKKGPDAAGKFHWNA